MPFRAITRNSLDVLSQSSRTPYVLPGAVPPGSGTAAQPDDPRYKVCDDFIRIVPFVEANIEKRSLAQHYQVRCAGDLGEPSFTARGGGSPWSAGQTFSFGQELEIAGSRFKKLSVVVRADELMLNDGDDVFDAQMQLAKVALVRALSAAIFASFPATDDAAELAGLPFYLGLNSQQDIAYDPAQGLIAAFRGLIALCRPSGGDHGCQADAIVASSRVRWRACHELESRGIAPLFRHCSLTGKHELHIDGVPVIGGRVPEPEGTPAETEAWAVKLTGPSAVQVWHVGGDSDDYGVRVQQAGSMAQFDTAGEATGSSEGSVAFGTYALLVPERESIARCHGIPSAAPV